MVFLSLIIFIGILLVIDWQLHYRLSDENSEKEQTGNPAIQKLNVRMLSS